jgi:hypothetical protein
MISIKPVSLNARLSIRDNLVPVSNVTKKSDLQQEKQLSPKNTTDEGRMISIKPVPWNACLSIRDNLVPVSNITEQNNLHQEKQSSPKNTTELGMARHVRSVF